MMKQFNLLAVSEHLWVFFFSRTSKLATIATLKWFVLDFIDDSFQSSFKHVLIRAMRQIAAVIVIILISITSSSANKTLDIDLDDGELAKFFLRCLTSNLDRKMFR